MLAMPASGLAADQNGVPGLGESPRAPIAPGAWMSFFFGGVGYVAGPFTFVSVGVAEIRVTDAYCWGDQFRVYDNGAALGDTSAPGSTACGGPSSADDAYADPDMSSGCFLVLGPGAHSITIEAIASPFGGGGAFVRLDNLLGYNMELCPPSL